MIPEEVCRSYAAALARVAGEKKMLEKVGGELALFADMYARNEGMRKLLKSPRIKNREKEAMVRELCKAMGLTELSRRFLTMLVVRRRIAGIGEISEEYTRTADRETRRQTALLRCASALTEAQLRGLRRALERITGSRVKLSVVRDVALLAGVVVQVGDKRYDGSIRGALQKIERALMEGVG